MKQPLYNTIAKTMKGLIETYNQSNPKLSGVIDTKYIKARTNELDALVYLIPTYEHAKKMYSINKNWKPTKDDVFNFKESTIIDIDTILKDAE